MDLQSIQALIELVNKSDIGEVKLEQGNFKLCIRHKDYHPKGMVAVATAPAGPVAAPVAAAPAVTAAAPKEDASPQEEAPKAASAESASYLTVKSPMIGTFYRSSSPDKDAFVKVGDRIEKGNVLCIIEAMKLFNEIESEISGTVVKVLVDNASPVEYDQPLFLIDPS
jgi:acetyl-CoA carboxylase biotin carboxyl carrier protein